MNQKLLFSSLNRVPLWSDTMMEEVQMGPRQWATVPPHSAVTLWTRKPPPYRLTGKMSTRQAGDWVSRDSLRLLLHWEMREEIQTPLLERSHSRSKQWMELCQFARLAWVINIWTVPYQEHPCGWMVILSASLVETYWRLPSTNCSGPTVKHGQRMIMVAPK